MKKFLYILFVVLAGTFFLSGTAAAIQLNFDDVNVIQTGTVGYAGDGTSAVGANIVVDLITGTGTPLNDGVSLTIENGFLNFATGPNISEGPSVWEFGTANSIIQIAGIVKDSGGTVIVDAQGGAPGNYIVEGSFTSSVANPFVTGGGSSFIFSGYGFDVKHPDLLDFYGIDPNLPFNFAATNIVLGKATIDPTTGAFVGTPTEQDYTNTAVPEPATMMLLGCGLIGIAAVGRKKYMER